ncbi:MAG TPA: EamA family transporter [Chloroflexota bacterium]|jgi:drug/metabolite transporter (DMT)-like permease|nr:EamA family transporter [Chloroflexota bacterium]
MAASLSLIFFSVLCGVAGQISLKIGMGQVGQIDPGALVQPMSLVVRVASSPLVLVGLFLYAIGAMSWLTVLSRVPLSFAYPLAATSYAFTPVLAWLLLRESIPSLRWLGILTICLGVFVVSRS